jgi:hypothetical protein
MPAMNTAFSMNAAGSRNTFSIQGRGTVNIETTKQDESTLNSMETALLWMQGMVLIPYSRIKM